MLQFKDRKFDNPSERDHLEISDSVGLDDTHLVLVPLAERRETLKLGSKRLHVRCYR